MAGVIDSLQHQKDIQAAVAAAKATAIAQNNLNKAAAADQPQMQSVLAAAIAAQKKADDVVSNFAPSADTSSGQLYWKEANADTPFG